MPQALRRSLVALVVFVSAAALQAEAERRPMTPEDLWAMERLGSPALSPDGRWVAFTKTTYSMDDNKGETDLWLVAADGSAAPRRLTWSPGADGSPVWSPDGRSLAFVSSRGEGPPQLFVLPVAEGGEARPVTDIPLGISGPRWFPDGERLAFGALTWPDLGDDFEAVEARQKEMKDDEVQAKISDSRVVRFWDHYRTDGRVGHFFSVDVKSGEVTDLLPGSDRLIGLGGLGGTWDLSPEGDEIAFHANTTAPPYQRLDWDLHTLSLASDNAGAVQRIVDDNPAYDGNPVYSPDGRYILYRRNSRVDTAPDFAHLALYDRRSGAIRGLAEDWDGQPGGTLFTPDGAWVLFHAQERGQTHLYAVPTAGGSPRRIAEGGVTGGAVAAKIEGGTRVVYLRQSLQSPAELMAVDLSADGTAGELRALTSVNAERLAELDLGTVGEMTYEGADGEPVHMHLMFPPGFDRSKKWPLLMILHGGPHGAILDGFHYRWNLALFASRGHVVAAPNFHGSTGYGQAFAESILGNHADKPFTDVMKAVDRLIAEGYVDEERMAAAGGSYGGYLVTWLLGHTDRFAALINHAGVYDLMAQFASDYTWGRPNNYGAAPWTDPERIDLYSPSRYAANFETPTLTLHGEKDYRVPYTQGVNLHGVLTGKGVPSRLVIFPNENHWILRPHSAKLWWQEVFDWLERYTQGQD